LEELNLNGQKKAGRQYHREKTNALALTSPVNIPGRSEWGEKLIDRNGKKKVQRAVGV